MKLQSSETKFIKFILFNYSYVTIHAWIYSSLLICSLENLTCQLRLSYFLCCFAGGYCCGGCWCRNNSSSPSESLGNFTFAANKLTLRIEISVLERVYAFSAACTWWKSSLSIEPWNTTVRFFTSSLSMKKSCSVKERRCIAKSPPSICFEQKCWSKVGYHSLYEWKLTVLCW